MFDDRIEAGRCLGQRLTELEVERPVILGLPRGGVPVAAEVARILDAPLDVIVVRKLGVPCHPEYAMGAIGEGGVRFVDWRVVAEAGVTATQLARVIDQESLELRRRAARFRIAQARIDISGRVVVIVDDGIATGSTATAAIRVARDLGAKLVIVAAPVAPQDTIEVLQRIADAVVVLETPPSLHAVGQVYVDFVATSDEEVMSILSRNRLKEADLSQSA
ncbi:MAG TPA: phosphoribosyltransferase family protein [Acidimicrobiia bacterium]